jgi:hypothetical protein
MTGKLTTIPLPSKGKVHPHIGPLKNLVRWTHSHHRVFGRLTPMVQGRAKKARVNPSENDVFLESDDQDDAPSAFSQTLSRFKKSPKRKGRHNGSYPAYTATFLLFELQRVLRDARMMMATTMMRTISLSLMTAKMMSPRALLVLLSALLVNPF